MRDLGKASRREAPTGESGSPRLNGHSQSLSRLSLDLALDRLASELTPSFELLLDPKSEEFKDLIKPPFRQKAEKFLKLLETLKEKEKEPNLTELGELAQPIKDISKKLKTITRDSESEVRERVCDAIQSELESFVRVLGLALLPSRIKRLEGMKRKNSTIERLTNISQSLIKGLKSKNYHPSVYRQAKSTTNAIPIPSSSDIAPKDTMRKDAFKAIREIKKILNLLTLLYPERTPLAKPTL